MKKQIPLPLLRILAVLLVIVFVTAFYLDWNFLLSAESQQYQSDYPDAIRSGISFIFLFSKLLWVIGTISGLIGVALVLFTKRHGLIPIILSAPFIALGAYLQAPQATYPSVEPMFELLLWCLSSALWAVVAMSTWLREP
jgi:hypothetical protein